MKTIADLEEINHNGYAMYRKGELRQAAIDFLKEIKDFNNRDTTRWSFEATKNYKQNHGLDDFAEDSLGDIYGWIKTFFRITDEELQ